MEPIFEICSLIGLNNLKMRGSKILSQELMKMIWFQNAYNIVDFNKAI